MQGIGVVTILGSGASSGVPLITCGCETCSSQEEKNKRLRTSIWLEVEDKSIVVDTGPDFRAQALRAGLKKLDGIIFTHMHFDHIAGIDDTRVFIFETKKPIPMLISQESFDDFSVKYGYFFREHHFSTAKVDPIILNEAMNNHSFLGLDWTVVSYFQASMKVIGFKIGDFAYITDIKDYEDDIIGLIKGANTLVISALKDERTPYHLSFDQAIEFSKKVGAKKTYLTHLSHDVNYLQHSKKLPQGVYLAYDGLKLEFTYERKSD